MTRHFRKSRQQVYLYSFFWCLARDASSATLSLTKWEDQLVHLGTLQIFVDSYNLTLLGYFCIFPQFRSELGFKAWVPRPQHHSIDKVIYWPHSRYNFYYCRIIYPYRNLPGYFHISILSIYFHISIPFQFNYTNNSGFLDPSVWPYIYSLSFIQVINFCLKRSTWILILQFNFFAILLPYIVSNL